MTTSLDSIDSADPTAIPANAAGNVPLDDPELAARLRLVLNRLARRLRSQTPET